MNIRLEVSPEADIEVEKDEDGNTIAILFKPLFTSRQGTAIVAYGVAETDQGSVLDSFSLVVSGTNGKVSKKNRRKAVTALVDLPESERGTVVKDDEDDEDDEES